MTTPRHFGLDAVRAAAIALVLACHVAAAVVVGVSVVLATALHVLVERPGMAMRAWASKSTVRAV